MDLKQAEQQLAAPSMDVKQAYQIDVPAMGNKHYNLDFLQSQDLKVLEKGLLAAKEASEFYWLIKACIVTKIVDFGLYAQANLTRLEYKKRLQKLLDTDKRRVSDLLQAGRFVLRYGPVLMNRGWQPEGMQARVVVAASALKSMSEEQVLDFVMRKDISLIQFRNMIRENKTKTLSKPSKLTLKNNAVYLEDKVVLTLGTDLPVDLQQDLEAMVTALIDSRSSKSRLACFAVPSKYHAKIAARVFRKFMNGKYHAN